MPSFTVGQTHLTTDGVLTVDGLQPGVYRFRLEVEDNSRNLSLPMEVTVTVPRPPPPPPPPPPVTGTIGNIGTIGTIGGIGGIRTPIRRIPVDEPIIRKPINPRIFEQ